MRHKRQKDLAPGEPARKRFRRNVADLVLSNQISAERAEELRRDALASGSTGVRDLVKGADGQYALGRGRNPNAARDLKRRFLKKNMVSGISGEHSKFGILESRKKKSKTLHSFFLMNSWMLFCKRADFLQESRDLLFHTSALCKHSKEHLLHMQRIFEAPEALAMGIAPL